MRYARLLQCTAVLGSPAEICRTACDDAPTQIQGRPTPAVPQWCRASASMSLFDGMGWWRVGPCTLQACSTCLMQEVTCRIPEWQCLSVVEISHQGKQSIPPEVSLINIESMNGVEMESHHHPQTRFGLIGPDLPLPAGSLYPCRVPLGWEHDLISAEICACLTLR
jgi:hypothetical protein